MMRRLERTAAVECEEAFLNYFPDREIASFRERLHDRRRNGKQGFCESKKRNEMNIFLEHFVLHFFNPLHYSCFLFIYLLRENHIHYSAL